jgi:hypothetical protein
MQNEYVFEESRPPSLVKGSMKKSPCNTCKNINTYIKNCKNINTRIKKLHVSNESYELILSEKWILHIRTLKFRCIKHCKNMFYPNLIGIKLIVVILFTF